MFIGVLVNTHALSFPYCLQAVTLGFGWVAVATDKRLVRLFSIGGMQREVIAVPGPVVCLAAHGNQLLVVYHAGAGKCFT